MSPSSRHDLSKAQLDFRFEADGHGTLSQGDHEWLGAAVDSHLGHGHGAETAMEKINGRTFLLIVPYCSLRNAGWPRHPRHSSSPAAAAFCKHPAPKDATCGSIDDHR